MCRILTKLSEIQTVIVTLVENEKGMIQLSNVLKVLNTLPARNFNDSTELARLTWHKLIKTTHKAFYRVTLRGI